VRSVCRGNGARGSFGLRAEIFCVPRLIAAEHALYAC
jgi:hypothetical protein